jgi:hypothetical protein
MNRFLANLIVTTVAVVGIAYGQAPSSATSQLATPPSSGDTPTTETPTAIQPIGVAATSDNSVDITLDPASLLPDLPPLPGAKATLVGGTIEKLDRVQDRVIVRVFGGGKTSALFDGRTQIYRDGKPVTVADLKTGERIYIDTILYNGTVFARSIHFRTSAVQGESQGVVLSYRAKTGELVVRDVTSPTPLKLHLTSGTRILREDKPASVNDLSEGALVSIQFGLSHDGHDVAEQISILAVQGTSFTFAGKVTFLDLHAGVIVLASMTNNKTYEIYFDPDAMPVDSNLREGAAVTAQARLDGSRYVARSLTVDPQPAK